jgi:hypothetical protein
VVKIIADEKSQLKPSGKKYFSAEWRWHEINKNCSSSHYYYASNKEIMLGW